MMTDDSFYKFDRGIKILGAQVNLITHKELLWV